MGWYIFLGRPIPLGTIPSQWKLHLGVILLDYSRVMLKFIWGVMLEAMFGSHILLIILVIKWDGTSQEYPIEIPYHTSNGMGFEA